MTVPAFPATINPAADPLRGIEGDPPHDETALPYEACDVCPHPLEEHDSIGLRYCRATLAGAFTRGCVCRVT